MPDSTFQVLKTPRHGDRPIRTGLTETVLITLALTGLAACGPRQPTPDDRTPARAASATGEAAYRRPPALTRVIAEPAGRVRLEGTADPGSRVRLASPSGQSLFSKTDATGVWRLSAPPSARLRLFSLSMVEDQGSVQAEGYLAVAPGLAAQLRAGDGALVLTPQRASLAVTALDFDRKGAAVVSGRAPRGAAISLTMDGKAVGEVAADAEGAFTFDLGEPLSPGLHDIRVADGALSSVVQADATPGDPPASGPFTASPMGSGWRIIWMPPGGGIQTTLLFGGSGPHDKGARG
jgi:hypothetical protein